jgi:putative transcriptional regulator
MTRLGQYFKKKSIKKSEVSKKTGVSKSRLSLLCNDISTKLSGKELYLISLAIEVDTNEIVNFLYGELELKSER